MNSDGSNEVRLTDDFNLALGNFFPKWSPDGKKIVFTRDLTDIPSAKLSKDLGRAIIIMDADGGNQVNISNRSIFDAYPPAEYTPDWQPLTAPPESQSSVVGFSSSSYSAYEDSGSIPITVTRTGYLNATASCYYSPNGVATAKGLSA